MNIGIDIRSLMFGRYSGVGVYTYNLLKNLFEIDSENQYFLFYNSYRDVSTTLPKFEYENVKYCGFQWPNKLFNLKLALFNTPKIDLMLEDYINASTLKAQSTQRQKIDLFFTPNWLFTAFSSYCKNIITIHDLSIFQQRDCFSLKQKLWHKAIKIPKLISSADAVICVSESTKQDILDVFKTPVEKLYVVHEGIEMENFTFDKATPDDIVQKKHKISEKYFLTLSNIDPRKNIDGTIQAFELFKKRNPESEMGLVIGGGRAWNRQYAKKIKNLVEKSPFRQDIRTLGYISERDKVALLRKASAFLFPSFYEGFGLAALEAMLCEVAVVTSQLSSLPEIVENSALLVDPFNIYEITLAMETLTQDTKYRNILRKKGLETSQKFSWQKTATQTKNIFDELLKI